MQNMNKRSRKRNDNRVAAGMAVICFLLAVGLFISVFMLGQKQKEINELRQELVSMAEVEEKVQKQTEDSENGGDAAAEEKARIWKVFPALHRELFWQSMKLIFPI